jgi:hypothetical protein
MTNAGIQRADARTARRRLSVSSVAWQALDRLPFDEWVDQGRRLGMMGRTAGWWVGDWLLFGNLAYGERYARAARITGYDVQTLMNMVYVASRFETSRRRETLSWSHHAELAALAPDEQDRWLDQAEADRLSVKCLRDGLRYERKAGRDAAAELASAEGDADLPLREPLPDPPQGDDPGEIVCPACGHAFEDA